MLVFLNGWYVFNFLLIKKYTVLRVDKYDISQKNLKELYLNRCPTENSSGLKELSKLKILKIEESKLRKIENKVDTSKYNKKNKDKPVLRQAMRATYKKLKP